MESSTAFAPANLSLVFATYDASPPHGRGSLGVGITLTEGVEATVRRLGRDEASRILVGGEVWEFPTVRSVLHALAPQPVAVEITAAFPFGCGFGMSGASALATAFALNDLFSLGRDRADLGMIAHHAEVENATGLGDVGGQFNGGIMIKTRRYQPLTVEHLPIPKQTLHTRVYGPILTSEVINSAEKLRAINAAGHAALADIQASTAAGTLTMVELFAISRRFAESSALMQSQNVQASIAAARRAGHEASMIMLGEAVVATGPFPGSRSVTIGS
jgi:pantoate kinase